MAAVESLEGRQLLAWGQIPQLISLDDARSRFPTIDGRGQTIVVIDSGVNMSHPKIVDSIFKNSAEVVDGKDNDGNGYADDVNGWDFLANDRDPKDEQGHGTMVASTLAANRFTNTGNPHLANSADYKEYEGVASGAKLLPLRISGTNLSFSDANLEKALQYVIKNRARFNITAINFSLGVSGAGYARIEDELRTLDQAGVFMAGVSGNGGGVSSSGARPGDSPYAMSVGAVNPDGSMNSITIRGSWLDVVAPGNKVPYLDRGSSYWIGDAGTSYAAPWIAGMGALIKQVNKNFSNEQIRQIIKDSGQNVYDSTSKLTFKRLDVAGAIDLAYKRSGAAVPSTVTPTPVPPSNTSQSPYSGTPISIPGLIEAENFDNGGQNVSFWDSSGSNAGGKYRSTDVDIEACSEGGQSIGLVTAGEWLEYTVDVKSTGTYTLEARVASQFSGGAFHVEVDGADKTGRLSVPNTGGWQKWTTISKSGISIAAGRHTIRVKFDANASVGYVGNFNWLKLNAATTSTPAPAPAPSGSQTPFGGTPISLPGTIQAENFDDGGQNVSFWDSTSGNDPGKFRSTAVDIEACSEGGYSIGYAKAGEWMEYTVDVKTAGTYALEARVASQFSGGAFHVEVDGSDKTGRLNIPNTGGWQKWTTISKSGIALSAGRHVLRLKFDANSGAGFAGNLNWLKLSTTAAAPAPAPSSGARSAFSSIAAASFNASQGVNKSGSGISYVDSGDWVAYTGVDFGSGGATKFNLNIAVPSSHAGKKVLVRIGGTGGQVIGTLVTRATGGWGNYQTQSISIARTSGVQNVYLTFESGDGIGNIASFRFA